MQCAICFEDIGNIDNATTTSCNHHFHKNCLEGWINHKRAASEHGPFTCPLCRHDITDDQPKFYYWEGTRELKMFRTKECEVRYYRNRSIKYRLYFDSNNDITSGTIFNRDGSMSLDYHDINPSIMVSLRFDDNYGYGII